MKNTVKSTRITFGFWSILFKIAPANKPTVRQRKLNIRRV